MIATVGFIFHGKLYVRMLTIYVMKKDNFFMLEYTKHAIFHNDTWEMLARDRLQRLAHSYAMN